jgi:hypothetical protein
VVTRQLVRAVCWALGTTLSILRPALRLALLPLGVVFLLLALVGGFVLEARGVVDHRWTLLALGLGLVAITRLYDRLIAALYGLGRS